MSDSLTWDECTMQNLGLQIICNPVLIFFVTTNYQTIILLIALSEENDAQKHVWSVFSSF